MADSTSPEAITPGTVKKTVQEIESGAQEEEFHDVPTSPKKLYFDSLTEDQKVLFNVYYYKCFFSDLGEEFEEIIEKFGEADLQKMLEADAKEAEELEKIKIKKKGGRPKGAKNKPKPEASEQTKTVSSKRKEPEPEPVLYKTEDATMTAKVRYFRVFSSPLLLIYNFY